MLHWLQQGCISLGAHAGAQYASGAEMVADICLKLKRSAVSSAKALGGGLSNTFYFSPPEGVLDR